MLGWRITAAVSWPTESRGGFANMDSIGHAFAAWHLVVPDPLILSVLWTGLCMHFVIIIMRQYAVFEVCHSLTRITLCTNIFLVNLTEICQTATHESDYEHLPLLGMSLHLFTRLLLILPSDCHGFWNPWGFTGRVQWVWVWVGGDKPCMDPYPLNGLMGFGGFHWRVFPIWIGNDAVGPRSSQWLVSAKSDPNTNCTVHISPPPIKDTHCQPILFIRNLWSQSILKHLPMSLSSLSLDLRRKRKATERAESNGDPLVARKKARDTSKLATSSSTPSEGPATSKSVPNKISKVSQSYCWG
jgi:hypothetical protein